MVRPTPVSHGMRARPWGRFTISRQATDDSSPRQEERRELGRRLIPNAIQRRYIGPMNWSPMFGAPNAINGSIL